MNVTIIDAGPRRRACQLESLGYRHIVLQGALKTDFSSAAKIIA
jgi:hypothetical protein